MYIQNTRSLNKYCMQRKKNPRAVKRRGPYRRYICRRDICDPEQGGESTKNLHLRFAMSGIFQGPPYYRYLTRSQLTLRVHVRSKLDFSLGLSHQAKYKIQGKPLVLTE